MNYDVIVIGGGTAGLMAAATAGEFGAKTLLLEKGKKLGKKLLISGGGRCNVTNRVPIEEIIKNIPGNGRFLYSAFSVYNNEDIIQFFESSGVPLKEEDHGRMFPVSDKAESIMNVLLGKLKQYRVHVQMNTPVASIVYENGGVAGVKTADGAFYPTHHVIVAVGGAAVPSTGSTGDGYPWAKEAGHTIADLFPTEVPITSDEAFIKQKTLQGLSLRNVALKVKNPKGKVIITHQMDMIFTHFGISGPAALRCSQFVVQTMKKFGASHVDMELDLLPNMHLEQLIQEILKRVKEDGKKAIKNTLKGLVPERFLQFLFERNNISEQLEGNHLSKEQARTLAENMKQFSFKVNGTLPLEKAFVTGGGVSIKEIHPKEMASKLVDGLYFCGEILDIHGYTGGYNITAAFVTGRLAGMAAASKIS